MREKFMFFWNFMETANKLPDEMRLKYYDSIMDYVFKGIEPTDPVMAALINSIKPSLDKEEKRGGNHNPTGQNQHKEVKVGQKEVKVGQSGQSFLETETETETISKKENVIKEKVSKFGELGFVRLTDEQYTTLKQKYSDLDAAIEVLDTWLGTTGSKHRNKNHYAYFKQNSWVWERLAENHPKESQKIEYALPKTTTKEEIRQIVEQNKLEAEENKKRATEAQKRSDFIKSKGYASTFDLIDAGKEVYDRVMSEYRQAQGF